MITHRKDDCVFKILGELDNKILIALMGGGRVRLLFTNRCTACIFNFIQLTPYKPNLNFFKQLKLYFLSSL